ncbi:NepR family anti-sigma factor [Methylobacterium haplocladii]|uniref:Anti-sigma factor NepR domain-containing protein n=1 Tax=Methylobacterium haplocladii TaxID=1176176 RepID=A0A512IRV6_9HYPH|nr:NepR family anti-sigma factor [Methylobacterium haplocladii]GEP00445.1 hypothetical protein MHA02_28320 [Methylobacterium haplocladii]GJD82534.1 hypothetical protein HPGCJGGD_0391 [Methylobacterium haplocladii]GLS59421.1 hypothetical protein GCM10007887_20870 [Methylobacterium haplocladii]
MTDDRRDRQGAPPPAPSASGSGAGGSSADGIGADDRRRIGRNLRLLYGSVLDQPLPERFTRLIDELAAASKNSEGS